MKYKFEVTHPDYVIMSSDYSQQEPKLTAFVAQEPNMLQAFKDGRDIYATISSIAFGVPYEECLEHHPVTGEYQPEGKARRSIGKVLVLGINYGMSVASIGQDMFGTDDTMTDEEKTKRAQEIFDAVMKGFPDLANAIQSAQYTTRQRGYTETMLGRRRYHPDMQLPYFEFIPEKGYVNPDIDPLDPDTMQNRDKIPKRIVESLEKEFAEYIWYSQIAKRTKELKEEHIKVVNNTKKIEEASRKVFNAMVQGSAADLTKMAILRLTNNAEWRKIGGRFLCPIHDELLVEVPFVYREEGAQILKESMEQAGSFLPFKITCDIEQTFRWYGLEVEDILQFDKPSSLDWDNMTPSQISWVQCMLVETEHILPIYKDADGNKPIGIAAKGVNGRVSPEIQQFCHTYKQLYNLKTDAEFLDFIGRRVLYGC